MSQRTIVPDFNFRHWLEQQVIEQIVTPQETDDEDADFWIAKHDFGTLRLDGRVFDDIIHKGDILHILNRGAHRHLYVIHGNSVYAVRAWRFKRNCLHVTYSNSYFENKYFENKYHILGIVL